MTTSADNKIIKSKPPTPKTFEHEAIKIGVVPEHFSTPFHLGLERDIFNESDLNVDVIEYPRGTGSMCTALREGQLDVAVALTEGETFIIELTIRSC
jgi:ABC-type nitrate/sulfonate/bicarbonate transport system substrate-binding protein